jgi:hypothetical protein
MPISDYDLTDISFRISNVHFNAMTKHCNRKCVISSKTKGLPKKDSAWLLKCKPFSLV